MKLKFFVDRDKMFPYPFYIADLALMLDMQPIAGQNLTMSFGIFEKNRIYMHYDTDAIAAMGQGLLERVINEKGFYEEVIRQIYAQSEKMEKFTLRTSNLEVEGMSDSELVDWYDDYIRMTRDLRAWGWVPVLIDGMGRAYLSERIESDLHKTVESKVTDKEIVEYFSILTTSETPSEVQQEELARLQMLSNIQKCPEKKDAYLEKHLKDFGWLTYGYSGPAMTKEYLLKVLESSSSQGEPENQIKAFHGRYENIKKQKQEIFEKLQLPADLTRLFKISAKFMAIKDFRKGVYQRSYLAMDKIMSEIAKRLGVDLKSIKFMLFDEVKDALLNQKRVDYAPLVAQRLVRCCLLAENGKFKIYQGSGCDEQIKKWLGGFPDESKYSAIKELKGSVAFSGKVKGTVKIVLVAEDVDKVVDGDILVSSATNPDLIVAMKRAAAFVTDTGGITSHAAIVARELKKPCVVGTGLATHVLKDGDSVEVDAEKGIVKII